MTEDGKEVAAEVLEIEVANAVWQAVKLGIDDAVYRKQDKWRSFPATLIGVDLYALKIELEKSMEIAFGVCLRDLVGKSKDVQR